ncbi:MAG: hypothetical protein ACM3ZE_07050 [Myxococcales bacterium]
MMIQFNPMPLLAANPATSSLRRRVRCAHLAAGLALAVFGCRAPTSTLSRDASRAQSSALPPQASAESAITAAGSSAGTPSPAAPSTLASSQAMPECSSSLPTPPVDGVACGPLDCRQFASAEQALAYLIHTTSPLVLAVGEIHAQKGSSLKASPTQRFATLLPRLCGRARDLVIELWTARNDCGDDRVERVNKAQKPVTSAQASTNKNEFFELGNVAKANHIQPHALVPSCEDYQSIVAAKEQDIARMLELTATQTAEMAENLLQSRGSKTGSPMVLLYGGAMHNDLSPAEGRESFSYGPRLARSTSNRMTELDLVLREQVRDTDLFRRMAWYPYFRSETLEKQFTLYRVGPRSFTLIFPNQAYLP